MPTLRQPPPSQTVQLHPAQQRFLQSKALFRAFCGGIGSGKSWCGSYDLIRRAKPGRLYLVGSPSYTMLADSTMRSFVAVATGLGVLDPKAVKQQPPGCLLRTGAEVIFRSADDPERLRGPNLSGCWLDEASLMGRDAFNVTVGRLREGGEQGWLTATFTPKGRAHWTAEVFGGGRPNTELVRCRTADNPFLPAEFAATVGGQYTAQLRLQELEGEFVSVEGALFRRDWFRVVDAAPGRTARVVRAWDLAATPKDERRSHDPDWTAGVKMARDPGGTFYVLDVRRLRGTPEQVRQAVRSCAEADGHGCGIVMEQEPGSAGVAVADSYLRLLAGYSFKAERSTGSKADRATPLAAQAEGGAVRLVRGQPWLEDFLGEAELFPYGRHDDIVDAASLAFGRLAAGRSLWFRQAGEVYDYGGAAGPTEEDGPGGRVTTVPAGRPVLDLSPDAPGWRDRGDGLGRLRGFGRRFG